MSEGTYFPRRNGGGRPWLIAAIAALLLPSISAIIVIAQMHQKQRDFEIRLRSHGLVAAHGTVPERLREHDTRLNGQERSLDTIKKSNERLSNELHQLKSDLRVLQQQVDIEHRYGIDE